MLRLTVWLLLIANVAFFAWTQGYLASLGLAPVEQAEPERLQAQIRPETLRLLNGPKDAPSAPDLAPAESGPEPTDSTPAPASTDGGTPTVTTGPDAASAVAASPPPPPPEPTACWLAGGFTAVQADALRSALSGTGLPGQAWQLAEVQTGGRWVVYMGRYSPEQLERKRSELRELNVDFRTLPPPLGPALALGTYSSEAAAQQGLQDVSKKGVRTARVVQERTESSAWTLRLPAVTEAQRATVAGLGSALAGKRLQACE